MPPNRKTSVIKPFSHVLAELDEFIKLAEEQTIKGMTAEVAEYSKKLRKQL